MERVLRLQPIKMEKRVDYANTIRCVNARESVHASECVSNGLFIPYFIFQSS